MRQRPVAARDMSGDRIAYRRGLKYQLAAIYGLRTPICPPALILTEFVELDTHGWLQISRGYAWDGADGPTIDTPDSMRGSLVHDAFYQLMARGLLGREHREAVDDFFLQLLLEDGMLPARAQVWHTAVRLCGEPGATKDDVVLFAPNPPEDSPWRGS
jgi:hypothetical protein